MSEPCGPSLLSLMQQLQLYVVFNQTLLSQQCISKFFSSAAELLNCHHLQDAARTALEKGKGKREWVGFRFATVPWVSSTPLAPAKNLQGRISFESTCGQYASFPAYLTIWGHNFAFHDCVCTICAISAITGTHIICTSHIFGGNYLEKLPQESPRHEIWNFGRCLISL